MASGKLVVVLAFLHIAYGNILPPFGYDELFKRPSEPKAVKNPPSPILVRDWPVDKYEFGQITGVAIDSSGNPAIFHRAERNWSQM